VHVYPHVMLVHIHASPSIRKSYFFNIGALSFFLNFYMWRIEFTNQTFKKLSCWYFWPWRPQSLTHTVDKPLQLLHTHIHTQTIKHLKTHFQRKHTHAYAEIETIHLFILSLLLTSVFLNLVKLTMYLWFE